jgi:hypothetical protein
MSADIQFLTANYSNIKKSVQFVINEDKDRDGLLEGAQQNTLDASCFGPMGWISSLYLGVLAAEKAMAIEMDDMEFASECDVLLKKGQKNIVEKLFNGEYLIHIPDPKYPDAINSNDGCHIDQVMAQSLTFQAGVPERVIPEKETVLALNSIWKYNYAPDEYVYQEQHKYIKGARIYGTASEAGTIMCTWPKVWDEKAVPGMDKRADDSPTWLGPGGYFDECMNGFEYQLASHMINEGLITEGLAVAKSVHERYGAKKRNPYNEIECGDHCSRSMASYGIYNALCGFDYHRPKGILGFDPKIDPENFKSAFISAEGWGSFSQTLKNERQTNVLELNYGKLKINNVEVVLDGKFGLKSVQALLNGQIEEVKYAQAGLNISIQFNEMMLNTNDKFELKIQ